MLAIYSIRQARDSVRIKPIVRKTRQLFRGVALLTGTSCQYLNVPAGQSARLPISPGIARNGGKVAHQLVSIGESFRL